MHLDHLNVQLDFIMKFTHHPFQYMRILYVDPQQWARTEGASILFREERMQELD
jgi:hypothetical protein